MMYYSSEVFSFLLLIFFINLVHLADCTNLARGFNENINWVTFEEGHKDASLNNKPILLLIHKTWCGACKALKKDFQSNGSELEELSKQFVMINTEDEEEPVDKQFSPDGGYIPRIFFLNSKGEVQKEIYNKAGNENYKYYYSSVSEVAVGMKLALETMKAASTNPLNDEL